MQSDYIKHHGVRGQKWGVRRFQNKDGTLTAAGRKRKSEGIDDTEKKKGLTDKQKSILKKVAIGAAVTAGAGATAYFLKKYADTSLDTVIKSGTNIQHMSKQTNEILNKPFYASYLKSDNAKYAANNFFGTHWNSKMDLASSKDIKVAGNKTAEKVFKKWIDSNPDAGKRFGKQSYYSFNKNLNSPDIRDKELYNDFYNELKKQGYDAIRDRNDQVQSKIKSPVIIFNKLGDIKVSEITKL